jgi:ABC-type multidrug transport system ATPase subunit
MEDSERSPSSSVMELHDLCKCFGDTLAVDHVSITLQSGQI